MPQEIERRWLVIPEPWDFKPKVFGPAVPVTAYNLAQTSLQHPEEAAGVIERVRTSLHIGDGMGDIVGVHTHTVKRPTDKRLVRLEEECEIDSGELKTLLERRHPDCEPIQKVRRVFEWKGKTFELDSLSEPVSLHILECELENEDDEVELPPFLRIIREITEEPGWTNSEIARKDWKHPDRLIPGVALDRLVWKHLHPNAEDRDPLSPPKYSTDIKAAELLLEREFKQGEAIELHRAITGMWVAHTQRFFYFDDPAKRHYDDTAYRLSAWGHTLPHAVSVLVAVNGLTDLEESEWLDRWAWEWGNGDEPGFIKTALRL
jgi:CYTH domain-containing protein